MGKNSALLLMTFLWLYIQLCHNFTLRVSIEVIESRILSSIYKLLTLKSYIKVTTLSHYHHQLLAAERIKIKVHYILYLPNI